MRFHWLMLKHFQESDLYVFDGLVNITVVSGLLDEICNDIGLIHS